MPTWVIPPSGQRPCWKTTGPFIPTTGYSITNHYRVDPRFGTLDDYRELALRARQKRLKLIYDEVLNHIGKGYCWLDYPDTLTIINHRQTVNHDAYASPYDKPEMTSGWFGRTIPDMNAQNEYMVNYLIQNTIWWAETLQQIIGHEPI